MTNEQYHADKSRISKSGLDLVNKSPAHYYSEHLDPKRPSKPPSKKWGEFGEEFHMSITQRALFEKTYYCIDDTAKVNEIGGGNPRATTAYKEWKAKVLKDNEGKSPISVADFDVLRRMSDSVLSNRIASELFESGQPEVTTFFTDTFTGEKCKCRPDWISSMDVMVDLKSTRDASPKGFSKSVWDFRYYVQDPFYIDGYNSGSGNDFLINDFIFLAVEKEAPYLCALYVLKADYRNLGRMAYMDNLQTYKRCKESGIWPGYSGKIETMEAPKWAKFERI